LGTLLGKHQIEIWRFPLSLVEVDRWKRAQQATHRKHTKRTPGKGKVFVFGTSGKDHGSFSLLLPRCPGLVEDRRADKKKNTSFFWPHFLGDPFSTPNRIERVSFFFSIFLS
jgi:hypothetical protein